MAQTGNLEINDLKTWPNPYDPYAGNIHIGYTLTQAVDEVDLRLYTVSFRHIRTIMLSGSDFAGGKIATVDSSNFNTLANGSYYFILIAKQAGKQVKSRAAVIIILK